MFLRRTFISLPFILLTLMGCKKDNAANSAKNSVHAVSSFSIPADSVILNPSGNAPLSALLNFKSSVSGHTEIVVLGKNGAASNVKQTFTDNGTSHSIPVLGLYADYKNTVYVYVIDKNLDSIKSVINITTKALPANVPNYIHTDIADVASMESGFNLVSSFSGYPAPPQVPYMVDSFGDIRWYLDFTNNPTLSHLFYDCGIERLQNGNYRFADQYTGKIYEVDVLGNILHTWGLGQYTFHHDIYEKPNGNFLVTVTNPNSTHTNGTSTIEDYIIEIDRSSGAILNTWDLKESLNEYRTTLSSDASDWIHTNGIVYDASDNTIIISGRVQGVFKLTYDNHVKWVLGPHKGWGKNRRGEDLNQYLLTPLDAKGTPITDTSVIAGTTNAADFEWNWYQHSPSLRANGDLMLFDNGDIRNYNPNAATKYSRAVEYKIDESKMTVQQVWAYGKDRGTETHSTIVSSVQYYPTTGHVLFSPGYQVPNATGSGGKIVEVDYATQKVVFQMSISSANGWGFHRVFRMPLYPNGNPYK